MTETGIDAEGAEASGEDALVLAVTAKARGKILDLRSDEENPESMALWIEVTGVSGGSFTYDMFFQPTVDAESSDWVHDEGGLAVVIPATSITKMRGAVLDLSKDLLSPGMVMQNPNVPPAPPSTHIPMASPKMTGPEFKMPPADLTGDLAQRVIAVLEQQINPAIASHGGRADLVAVEGVAAYLRLSGGCAGCGMAQVTLSEGIVVAIREFVPEIEEVIDVTDHAAGSNPYYEAAKK